MKKTLYGIPLLLMASSALADISGSGVISYVADGDTYWIQAHTKHDYQGIVGIDRLSSKAVRPLKREFKTRVLNIDTAESVHPDAARNGEAGKKISSILKDELSGVQVNFRCKDKAGYYGRPLCTVYRSANGSDIGIELIERGYTEYVTKYGKHPWDHQGYAGAQLRAKTGNVAQGESRYTPQQVEKAKNMAAEVGGRILRKVF